MRLHYSSVKYDTTKQSCQNMHITLKKILCWNINHHALTMCVLYHHEVHFYENFKRCQKCTK